MVCAHEYFGRRFMVARAFARAPFSTSAGSGEDWLWRTADSGIRSAISFTCTAPEIEYTDIRPRTTQSTELPICGFLESDPGREAALVAARVVTGNPVYQQLP